ncbi:hypothetical protein Acsp04_03520 [Actinomadura sp. NBRC 104425]|nr:hypothetical protein Acsp04_03520 [Actinomadura sp. NBRC 104425]
MRAAPTKSARIVLRTCYPNTRSITAAGGRLEGTSIRAPRSGGGGSAVPRHGSMTRRGCAAERGTGDGQRVGGAAVAGIAARGTMLGQDAESTRSGGAALAGARPDGSGVGE